MKKNPKDKNTKAKDGKPLKDIIPSNYQHIRDPLPINSPQTIEKEYTPENYPKELNEEWPSDETDIQNFQSPLLENPEEIFKDPDEEKIFLPKSLYSDYLNEEIKWSRPLHYIIENKLENDIRAHLPKKNAFKFREKVHEKFREEERKKKMEEEGILEQKSEKSDSEDNNITGKKDENAVYKDYFNILRTKPNITVVKFIQRQETEEEYNERIEREKEEIEKFKIEKKKNKNLEPRITEVNMEKQKINEASPSKINMKETYPIYCRWLASIFEIIKDRNITDVNSNCTLFQRIFPQENGVPIYNPKGIYWIKLYNLGKLRKVIIDDRMPCDKYDRFFLPKCDNLEEIWPAILTKALIKLFSYKIVSNNFRECGDYEVIYALTGFIPEMVDLVNEKNLYKMFENYNDEKNNNNENEENKNEDKKDEVVNKEDTEKNNISKMNNSSFISHEKTNNEIEFNIENNEENSKYIFLEKALSDENYTENNCYMFCYKKTNEQPKEDIGKKMEIEPQRIYDTNQKRRMNSLTSSPQKGGVVIIHGKKNRKVSIKFDNAEDLKKEIEKEEKQLIAAGQRRRRSSLIRFKTISSQNNKVILDIDKKKIEIIAKKFENLEDSNSNKFSKDNTVNQSKTGLKNNQSPIKERTDLYMDKIYIGVIYDIIEFFSNYNYNMSRLVPIDFSDLRAMIKNFNTNNIFKQLSREEKRKYIHQLKEIKMKQKEEKTKRIESLKSKGKMYYSIKIQNASIEEPVFIRNHTDEEIEMTKKILLNKWQFPPIEYLEHVYQQTHPHQENEPTSPINQNKNEHDEHEKKKKKEYTWSKDVYMQLIENNTEQFKEQKEPLIRKEGTWIEPNDFFKCFDSFIILYNPKIYSNNFDWDNLWYDTKDVMSINTQNKVLHLVPNENTKKSYMVIVFCVNIDNKFIFRDAPFNIHFILLKKDDKIEDGRIITLDSFFGTKHIDQLKPNEEYFIVFTGGLFPTGFYLKFFSDFTIEPLLYNDYLSDFRGYTKQSYTIEYPNLNKNDFYVLLRVSVKLEVKTKFVVINNNTKDKALKDYTELYVCENGNGNFKRNIIFDNIFELQPKQYFFVITCIPPYNVESDSFDIDILSFPEDNQILDVSQTNTAIPGEVNKAQAQLEQIEHITPYDISDKYKQNKHFILFKEYIFSGDIVYSSLNIKMRQFKKKEEEEKEENKKEEEEQNHKSKKNQKDQNPSQPLSDMIEIPIEFPIRLKLELYDKEDTLIYETDFYNQITLHNIIFEGQTVNEQKGKKEKGKEKEKEEEETNKPYRLICYLDESELPDSYKNLNPDEEYLDWIIRVFSSDTLGFCEDTHKEDKEKAVIASWEEAEPGRAEKAKNSRRRFLLMKKKNNGEELDEEEEKFLSEVRIRKTEESKNEDNEKNKNVKGKNVKEKKEKGKNEEKKEDEEKERTEINFNKKTSTVEEHSSLYIKNFLYYAYDKRCITYDHMFEQEQKVLNTEDVTNEKETNILKAYEENEKMYTESEEDKEKKKNEFVEENKKLYEEILTKRKDDEKKKEEVLKGRDDVKSILLVRAEAEVKLKELVELIEESENKNKENDDKKKKESNKFDFNSAFETYQEIVKSELKHPLIEKAFNLLSKKKEEIIEEELKKAGKGKEKEVALKLLEDIRFNHWKVSDELLTKLDGLVE